ncbi:hypothetical protein [Vulgatibacter sp.]|uniref:DoxX family protein n=1 Tax=Vulgatibacter sp. TaxID=1971226 RepID=UPI0035691C7F
MAPLIALLLTYALARLVLRHPRDRTLPGRLALAAMLILTASAHFTSTEALAAMIPPAFPAPVHLVHATGVAELAFAVLLVARPTPILGWTLVLFFLAVLPANIHSALASVGYGGHGPAYLWFRIPLQLLFIWWAAFFTGLLQRRDRSYAATREAGAR